jgi:sugar O-acyltransferase (sialic acid O-acetyltransferase NeuD family)
MEKIIIGAGGFAREIKSAMGNKFIKFFVDDQFEDIGNNIFGFSKINSEKHTAIIAIGDPIIRDQIVRKLPHDLKYYSFIDSKAIILDDSIQIGNGSIICAGVILTTNIRVGKHVHLNLNSTVGHDTIIDHFMTAAPGVNISGKCKIGERVYIGSNSAIKDGVNICNEAIIGMNSGVTKDIIEPGVYVGTPVKLLK